MSLYSDLNEVLTPYANKIKEINGSLGEINRWTSEARTLLITILRAGTYNGNQAGNIDNLESILSEELISWTDEWDYADGLLTNNGYTKTGNGSQTMENNGVTLASSAIYIFNKTTIEANGACEILCSVKSFGTSGNFSTQTRINLSNGTTGCQVFIANLNEGTGIYVDNGTFTNGSIQSDNLDKISDLSTDTDVRIKMKVEDGRNKVYVNNELLYQSSDLSNASCTANRLLIQGGSVLVKSIKWYIPQEA